MLLLLSSSRYLWSSTWKIIVAGQQDAQLRNCFLGFAILHVAAPNNHEKRNKIGGDGSTFLGRRLLIRWLSSRRKPTPQQRGHRAVSFRPSAHNHTTMTAQRCVCFLVVLLLSALFGKKTAFVLASTAGTTSCDSSDSANESGDCTMTDKPIEK